MASQRSGIVRAAALRSKAFSFAKASPMGLKSGEQARCDGGGFPMTPRHGHSAALAARSAPVAARHGGGGRGLIDEHEAVWVEVELALKPRLARCPHIRPALLGRVARAFVREMPWRLKKPERLLWATRTPCSAKAARSSC